MHWFQYVADRTISMFCTWRKSINSSVQKYKGHRLSKSWFIRFWLKWVAQYLMTLLQLIQSSIQQPLINSVLHEIFSIDVNHWNIVSVLLIPFLIWWYINVLFLIVKLKLLNVHVHVECYTGSSITQTNYYYYYSMHEGFVWGGGTCFGNMQKLYCHSHYVH